MLQAITVGKGHHEITAQARSKMSDVSRIIPAAARCAGLGGGGGATGGAATQRIIAQFLRLDFRCSRMQKVRFVDV